VGGRLLEAIVMKRTFWIVCALLCVSLLAQAAPQGGAGVEQAVLKLDQEWADALLKADAAKLDTLCAEAAIYVLSSGVVVGKTAYISSLKAGAMQYQAINRTEVQATVTGDTAVVTSRAAIKVKSGTAVSTLDARMVHVYARLNGRWQLLVHQTTKLG
jgi:ketosteroid isomerase-like protein